MSQAEERPQGRSYEKTFVVRAPLEVVWRAITEGEELAKWFCQKAECTPGVGGYQTVDWGGGMAGTQDITAWDAPHYFRAEARREEQAARGMELPEGVVYATEWYLESDGDMTRVRMVQSGFGEGPAWDGEYDGTYKGWDLFHQNLVFYLENYAGQSARSIVLMGSSPDGAEAAWSTFFGPQGLCASGSVAGLSAGDLLDITTSTGDRLAGKVRIADPAHRSFHAVLDSHQGVFNVEFPEWNGAAFAWASLLCFGQEEAAMIALEGRLQEMMARLFPMPVDPAAMPCEPEEAAG